MKCLSLKQPFADLLAFGEKIIELSVIEFLDDIIR